MEEQCSCHPWCTCKINNNLWTSCIHTYVFTSWIWQITLIDQQDPVFGFSTVSGPALRAFWEIRLFNRNSHWIGLHEAWATLHKLTTDNDLGYGTRYMRIVDGCVYSGYRSTHKLNRSTGTWLLLLLWIQGIFEGEEGACWGIHRMGLYQVWSLGLDVQLKKHVCVRRVEVRDMWKHVPVLLFPQSHRIKLLISYSLAIVWVRYSLLQWKDRGSVPVY